MALDECWLLFVHWINCYVVSCVLLAIADFCALFISLIISRSLFLLSGDVIKPVRSLSVCPCVHMCMYISSFDESG